MVCAEHRECRTRRARAGELSHPACDSSPALARRLGTRRVGADQPAAPGLNRLAAVHQRAGTAALCARPGRGRARPHRAHRETTIVDAARFTPLAAHRQFDGSAAAWKDAERERVLIFSQPYLENRLILVGRRGADVSATTLARPQGQTDRDRRGLLVRRGDRDVGPDVRAVAQRGRQPQAAPRRQADYTLMDELVVQYIVEQLRRRKHRRGCSSVRRRSSRASCILPCASRPDAESIVTGSTRSCAA